MDMDEKLEVLTNNIVQQLALTMANNAINNGERQNQQPHGLRTTEDKTLRIDLPDFDGQSQNAEVYFY